MQRREQEIEKDKDAMIDVTSSVWTADPATRSEVRRR